MSLEVEVNLSYGSLLSPSRPDKPLFARNSYYTNQAQRLGYDGAEFLPFRGVVGELRKTKGPLRNLSGMKSVRSTHVIPNYDATLKTIGRAPDRVRPGSKIGLFNIVCADAPVAKRVLGSLSSEGLAVVTYPERRYGPNPYGPEPTGRYPRERLQIHQEAFNDSRAPREHIEEVLERRHSDPQFGLCIDTYHSFGPASLNGEVVRPYGRPEEFEKALSILAEAGVITEYHIQAGRVIQKDEEIDDMLWLKDMFRGKKDGYLGTFIRKAKEITPGVPFVIEIAIPGLVKAGIIPKSNLIKTGEAFVKAHQYIIDFVKTV